MGTIIILSRRILQISLLVIRFYSVFSAKMCRTLLFCSSIMNIFNCLVWTDWASNAQDITELHCPQENVVYIVVKAQTSFICKILNETPSLHMVTCNVWNLANNIEYLGFSYTVLMLRKSAQLMRICEQILFAVVKQSDEKRHSVCVLSFSCIQTSRIFLGKNFASIPLDAVVFFQCSIKCIMKQLISI